MIHTIYDFANLKGCRNRIGDVGRERQGLMSALECSLEGAAGLLALSAVIHILKYSWRSMYSTVRQTLPPSLFQCIISWPICNSPVAARIGRVQVSTSSGILRDMITGYIYVVNHSFLLDVIYIALRNWAFQLYGFSQDISNFPPLKGTPMWANALGVGAEVNMEAFRTAKNVVAVLSLLPFPQDLDKFRPSAHPATPTIFEMVILRFWKHPVESLTSLCFVRRLEHICTSHSKVRLAVPAMMIAAGAVRTVNKVAAQTISKIDISKLNKCLDSQEFLYHTSYRYLEGHWLAYLSVMSIELCKMKLRWGLKNCLFWRKSSNISDHFISWCSIE